MGELQRAALCNRKIARDRQPEAGPAALLAAEGQEQAVPVLTRDSWPVIGYVVNTKPAGAPDIDADPGIAKSVLQIGT